MKESIKNIMVIVCIAMFVWFSASAFEVIAKNSSPNPEYSSMNVFAMMVGE